MRSFIQKLFDRSTLLGQLFRYGIVGGIAFVVDYGTLWLLTEVCHVHYLVSAGIAFVLGLVCNYLLSTRFVFGESRLQSRWAEFTAFLIIGVVGLVLNEIILYVCQDLIGIHYMLGKIISTVIVFFWNFLARRFLLFKS